MTTISPDIIETLQTWEELADAGRAVMQDLDNGRWLAGDIANHCATRYGENSLTKFATDIGIARAGTLREYARVSRFYSNAIRIAFGDEAGMSWSHFRTACAAGEDAELWLARAADEGWPVAALARAIKEATGKPVPPAKLYDGPGLVWQYANESRPYLVLDGDVSALVQGARVIVRVYAAGEGAE